jgi:uncharacterized protein
MRPAMHRLADRGRRWRRPALWHGLLPAAALGVLVVAAALLLPEISLRQAQAQFFWGWGDRGGSWNQPPRPRRPVNPPSRRQEWSPPSWRWAPPQQADEPRAPTRAAPRAENNRAPAPKRTPAETGKRALVLGDSMADWLGYGMEETFAESDADGGEWSVTRKHRTGSSLIRNAPRDVDWAQVIKETLAAERADVVVMMIGLADRQPMREEPPEREEAGEGAENPSGARRPARAVTHDFRSERWVELYTQRVDAIIAALKAKGVPVMWVGLPPINGPRARADLAFLNDIVKARAEKAGIVYVDVWDGFIEESGVYSSFGPDVMGQRRRLRSADGIHFTEPGAVKLAHFVDREIKRIFSRSVPVALPIPQDAPPDTTPSGPAPRPAAGPVISLTGGDAPSGGRLLGGQPHDAQAADPIAVKVLVKGESLAPQSGRADNFAWPPPHAVAEQDVAPPRATVPQPEPETTGAADAPALTREAARPGGRATR